MIHYIIIFLATWGLCDIVYCLSSFIIEKLYKRSKNNA
jgi:hypothetical protein